MTEQLKGNIGVLTLTNSFSLVIKINECGNGLQYQYQGDNDNTIYEAEIEYFEDTEDRTGYADEESLQAGFKTESGQIFFLGEFMKYNIPE